MRINDPFGCKLSNECLVCQYGRCIVIECEASTIGRKLQDASKDAIPINFSGGLPVYARGGLIIVERGKELSPYDTAFVPTTNSRLSSGRTVFLSLKGRFL